MMYTYSLMYTRDSRFIHDRLTDTCQSVQYHTYNDDEEDDIIVVEGEPGKVKKKHTHQEVVRALDEKLPLERRLALDRLRYGVQIMHQMQKPKASLTMRKFFQPIHKV